MDAKGNAVAVWIEFYKGANHLYSAKKPLGIPWVSLGEITASEQSVSLVPSKALVLNETGSGIAVWEEESKEGSEIHAARFVQGAWAPPVTLAAIKGKKAHTPSVGIDKTGDAVLVWTQDNAIFAKTLVDGILSVEPQIVSDPGYLAQHPHVAVDAEGNAVVVFERHNALHKFIAAASLSKESSSWTAPIDISGPSPLDSASAGYPVFCMNSIGDGVAIWKEWTGSNMVIQGAGYSLGTWSFIKTLSAPDAQSGAAVPAYDIAVALNKAGNILAIWPEDPSGTKSLQIKATAGVGLANVGPLPPIADPETIFSGIVSGKQTLRRFPAHADLINTLSWTSPGGVAHYNIYRGNLSSLISTTTALRFEDHRRVPQKRETYLITSVDQNGQESGPMTIIVDPL